MECFMHTQMLKIFERLKAAEKIKSSVAFSISEATFGGTGAVNAFLRLSCSVLQVQQPDMCEVKILMSPDFQKLAQFTNIYPIGHSEIFRIPRENDVVVTDPPSPRRGKHFLHWRNGCRYSWEGCWEAF